MAFSGEQLEILLANASESKQEISGLGALEDDPIPIELAAQYQLSKPKRKDVVEVELWEELEPMPEGESRVMNRKFLDVDGVEIEVCTNANGKHFVRHNLYWWIYHGRKNPDPEHHCIIVNLQNAVDRLPTIKWSGYRFRLETLLFSEDDVEVESVLLPLAMFEDLMREKSQVSYLDAKLQEEILSGEYKSKQNDSANIKLCAWLQRNSLASLLQTNNS
jgi:hypothetical protein